MKHSRLKFVTGLGLFASLLLSPSYSEATYAGVKSMGRANAVMASPLDGFTIAYNPAGLVRTPDRLDLGGYWVHFNGETKISDNDDGAMNGSYDTHESRNFVLPEIAVTQGICGNMVWGIAFYTKNFLKTDYDDNIAALGTSKLGFEYLEAVLAPAWAIRFNEDHSLGVSADLVVQRIKVNGLQNLNNNVYSKYPGHVTNKGYDYSLGVGVTVGWLSRFSNCLSIALAWSPEIKMQDFKDYKGLIAKKGQLHIPQRFMGGIAVNILPCFLVELDVEHVGWNDISALDHSIDELNHHRFGSEKGPGLGWRDQLFWRVGAEFEFLEHFAARLGYQNGRSPVRGSQAFLNMLTPYVIENWFTAGFTWNYFCYCESELSLYLAVGFNNQEKGTDAIPEEFGNGNVSLSENQFNLGLSWSRKF